MYCNLILMHVFLVSIHRFTTNYTLSNIGVHLRSETELGTSTLVQMWGSFKNVERLDPVINPLLYVLNEYLPSRLKIFKCKKEILITGCSENLGMRWVSPAPNVLKAIVTCMSLSIKSLACAPSNITCTNNIWLSSIHHSILLKLFPSKC